jgi:hypothetical protein
VQARGVLNPLKDGNETILTIAEQIWRYAAGSNFAQGAKHEQKYD